LVIYLRLKRREIGVGMALVDPENNTIVTWVRKDLYSSPFAGQGEGDHGAKIWMGGPLH